MIEPYIIGDVTITKFSPRFVVAVVDGFHVSISNLGRNDFTYTCSCGLWHSSVKNGRIPYCSHYLGALAQLIRQGKISLDKDKLNRVDAKGLSAIRRFIKKINNFEAFRFMEEKGLAIFCPLCKPSGHHTPIDDFAIQEISEIREGFLLKGSAHCLSCGMFFKLANNIDFELVDLKCPSCHKSDFTIVFKEIKKTRVGYKFLAALKCKTRGCTWKRIFRTGAESAETMIRLVKKVKVTALGIEVEMRQ